MGLAIRRQQPPSQECERAPAHSLAALGSLAGADIETKLIGDLSRDLHAMFDPVSSATLPIYFGPLLGRLYLQDL